MIAITGVIADRRTFMVSAATSPPLNPQGRDHRAQNHQHKTRGPQQKLDRFALLFLRPRAAGVKPALHRTGHPERQQQERDQVNDAFENSKGRPFVQSLGQHV